MDYKRTLAGIAVLTISAPVFGQLVNDPDVNDDGVVDFADLGIVRNCFFSFVEAMPECGGSDLTGNGQIDFEDLAALRQNFFATYPTPQEARNLYPGHSPRAAVAPTSVAFGDFNGDGRIDLISTNEASNDVSVMLRTNADGWQTINSSVEGRPNGVAVGDFNRDGWLDAVTANSSPGRVAVLTGTNEGEFLAPELLLSGDVPTGVVAGDLNNDGFDDFVTLHYNDLAVFIAQSNGGFAAPVTLPVLASTSHLEIADVNNDGELDLVVARDFPAYDLAIFRGTGDGSFAGPDISPALGSRARDMAVGFVNDDPWADAVICCTNTAVAIAYGTSQGGFQAPAMAEVPHYLAKHVAPADFDADGDVDLLLISEDYSSSGETTKLMVLANDGMGGFATVAYHPTLDVVSNLSVADLNDDQRVDLVLPSAFRGKIMTISGNEKSTFIEPALIEAGYGSEGVASADFDRDGFDDIAIADYTSGEISLLMGGPSGLLSPSTTTVAINRPSQIIAAHMNNDDRADLVVRSEDSSRVQVFRGGSNASFNAGIELPTNGVPYDAAVSDVNGDDLTDIVVALGTGGLDVFLGLPDGNFQNSPEMMPDPDFAAWTLALGDVNDDGTTDLVTLNGFPAQVVVFLNNDNELFQRVTAIDLLARPLAVTIEDLNDDGLAELVVAYTTLGAEPIDTLAVYIGLDGEQFELAGTYPVGVDTRNIGAADLNGDNRPDLYALAGDTGSLSVLLGNGDGGFQQPADFNVATKAQAVAMGDFNNDGRPDLATSSGNPVRKVTLLLGR